MQDTLAIAEAVVAAVNGDDCRAFLAAALGDGNVPKFKAQRCYVPKFELAVMDKLAVLVAAAEDDRARFDLQRIKHEHKIHVAVAQRFSKTDGTGLSPVDQKQFDALVSLAAVFGEWFESEVELPGRESAQLVAAYQHKPLYDPEMLYKNHQLLSLVTLTFREYKNNGS